MINNDKTNNQPNLNFNQLSIQVSLNGISFLIYDTLKNSIVDANKSEFKTKLTPIESLARLKHFLAKHHILKQPYNKIKFICKNRFFTFVPFDIFSEKNITDYQKYNMILNDSHTNLIRHDRLSKYQLVNVYSTFHLITDYIKDIFKNITIEHYLTILLSKLFEKHRKTEHPFIFINIEDNDLYLIIINSGELLYANSFEFANQRDYLYYLMITLKNLNLINKNIPIYFLNHIENIYPLYNETQKHLDNLNILKVNISLPPTNYSVSQPFLGENFVLFNSFDPLG